MERQSSYGSQGSAKSSATKLVKDAQRHGDSAENQNANNGFTTALFGVLFTLAKEKYSDSWKVAVLTVIVDFLLIMAILFNLEYPWAVDPHNGIFRFFYMIEIHKPLSATGYKFYIIVFYLLSAMLFLSVAICVWVAWCFKNDNFPFLWPIKFVRVVASLFFGMLYIAALNIFLVIMECAPSHGVWYQHVWHVQCFSMPHLVHLIVAFLSSVTFAVAALLLVIADHELQPMSRSLLAAPHSMCELKAQLAKTVITVVDVLLWGFPKVQGVTFAICTSATFYFHLKQLPYYTSWMNSFRLSFFAAHAWVGLHLGVLVFLADADAVKKGKLGFIVWDVHNYNVTKIITDSMLYGLPVVFLGAGLLGAIRLYYFFRVALRFQILQQQPNMYSKRVHRFADEKDVEICSRIARVWDEDGNLDQQCVDLAETIIRAGIQQFPKSPYLHIVYANLLIECRQQLQSGWAQLEEARHMPLNLSYRFSIFTREQEHKQKAAVSSSGESAADLVSYVEFQRNYRMIQSYHKAALVAMREFWRLLLFDAVNMNSLTSAFRKIEQMERLADKTYKVVLERYPKAVKLLLSYALFLETVKNDPWTAAQFYSEAEKQEEALENAEHDLAGEEGLTMRNSAIVTINAMGIIQMANKHAIKMLGYRKGELEGKNVSCLMPQPFSTRHNTYMRNYVTTGKAKILDSLREVVALHRDRYVFPIKILVTKSQGTGADAIFMGLLKEVEVDPHQIKAWLMPNGVTLCADQSFTDYAGWMPNDLIGKPFNTIAADPMAVDKLLEWALKSSEEELSEGHVQADLMLIHKYAEEVPVTVRVEMGGTMDQRLIVLVMTRCAEVVPTMVLDHHGRVLFANQAICSLLGTKPKDMRGRDIGSLLPQPFGFLHHRWIKEADMSLAKPPPSSCRAGVIHSLVSSNGVHVPVRMVITTRELAGVRMSIVRATRVTTDEALDEQRLVITTDQHGHIISVNAAHHATPGGGLGSPPPGLVGDTPAARPQVFGFPPDYLVSRKLYEALDIFNEWHGQGHSVMHAVKALAQQSAARPGLAWRVGVLPHYMSAETEKAALKLARGEPEPEGGGPGPPPMRLLSHRRSIKHSSTMLRVSMSKWRAAIMQVIGPEHTPTGTHYTIKLWRPELLTGVMEINEKMVVVKADSAAGLIFGIPASNMSQQPLSRFLKLGPPGANSIKPGTLAAATAGARTSVSGGASGPEPLISKESLLGMKHVKGGMKGKTAHKSGPRRVFEARHADGMPLQISFQVALKNGISSTRMMAAIKPLNLIKGNVAVLFAAMHGEDLDHLTLNTSPSFHRTRTLNSIREQPRPRSQAGTLTAMGAGGLPGKDGTMRRQGTSKMHGGGPTGPLPAKTASKLSAAAVGMAPGMASARTLNTNPGGAGSGAQRSDDAAKDGKEGPAGAGPLLDTQRSNGSELATARKIELKEGPAAPSADGTAANPGCTQTSSTTPQPVPNSGNASRDGSDNNRPPISDDSAMINPIDPGPKKEGLDGGADDDSARLQEVKDPVKEAKVGGSGDEAAARPTTQQGQQQAHHHHHHHHHHHNRHLSRQFLTRDWDHVLHVDPEEVPLPKDAEYDIEQHVGSEKDMTVSSSSSSNDDDGSDSGESDGDQHVGKNTEGAADKMTREEALQRKKTMAALEPSERVQYVKGVRRVKEWLASGYYFDRKDAEPVDSTVQYGLAGGGGDPWRGGTGRQQSRLDDDPPPKSSHHNRHSTTALARGNSSGMLGGAQAKGDQDKLELDPDDQLVTLDELAAEVEQLEGDGDESAEDREAEEDRQDGEEGEGGKNAEGRRDRRAAGGEDGWDDEGGGGGHSHAATDGATQRHFKSDGGSSIHDGGGVDSSGMSRGRRLKRLLKLLSGQSANTGVARLRLHLWIVIGLMLLVHTVCFLLLIIYIDKQKQFITQISAAGEAIDRAHYNAMYTRSIEAATRYAGFSPTEIPALEARLTADVNRLEYLHQGLYLGFKNLKRSTSDRLNTLWDAKLWNVTEYKDTKAPAYTSSLMTLWSLGNDFIAAVREVAFYAAGNKLLIRDPSDPALYYNATTATSTTLSGAGTGANAVNVTLPTNRFWLFVRANGGGSLYAGYLRVLNTLLILAQDNIANLKLIIIALLLVEGCLVCFAAIGYVFWLLWKATRARAALFTVFLVIPQGQLKALASRHITTTTVSDDDSDEEDTGGRKQEDRDDGASDHASVVSGPTGGAGARRSITGAAPEKSAHSPVSNATGRRGIKFKEDTTPRSHAPSETVLTRIKRAMSGEVALGTVEPTGHSRRFPTRKRLTHTTSDIKQLAWPFFAWGILICIIYLVSFLQFAGVEESLVNLKMFERSTAQAARTMYYVNELALEADNATQLALQPIVREEAVWLDTVYSTTLYGGESLSDGALDGAHDVNTGSLFAKEHHALLLFEAKGCMRDSAQTCLAANDKFYQVSRNAIDPMMRRLMQEARLLSLDDLADINHTSTRWQYVWQVAREDLHDGLTDLVDGYRKDALASFTAQGTLHTVIFAVSWVLWALYLWLLLKPYLQVASTETKRVAEMLSQLPTELDVEGMVEESWQVVADTQLDKSKLSIWEPKRGATGNSVASMAVSVIAALRLTSVAARRFSTGGKAQPQQDNATDDEGAGKGGLGSLASDGVGSVLSDKLKAAIRAAAAANGENGTGGEDAGDKRGASGLEAATQTLVMGSTLYGGDGGKVVRKASRVSGNQVAPLDSDEALKRISEADTGKKDDRHGSGRRNNRVAPDMTPSSRWAEPSGAEPGGADRPMSPLIDFPMPLLLAPTSEDGGNRAGTLRADAKKGATAEPAKDGSRPPSPFHFNQVVPVLRNTTQYWDEDKVWHMPAAAAAARASLDRTAASSGGSGRGRGNGAMASPVVAAVAPAAAGSDEVILPGEVDSPDAREARRSSSLRPSSSQVLVAPPPLLLDALMSNGSTNDRGLAATPSRPMSPAAAAATPALPAAAAAAGGPGVSSMGRDRRLSLEPGSRPMSPAGPSSRLGTPRTPAGGSGAAAGGPEPRLSVDAGSRPASRLSGLAPTAAKIDLPPPPPVFSRSGSGQRPALATTLAKSPSQSASASATAAAGGVEGSAAAVVAPVPAPEAEPRPPSTGDPARAPSPQAAGKVGADAAPPVVAPVPVSSSEEPGPAATATETTEVVSLAEQQPATDAAVATAAAK